MAADAAAHHYSSVTGGFLLAICASLIPYLRGSSGICFCLGNHALLDHQVVNGGNLLVLDVGDSHGIDQHCHSSINVGATQIAGRDQRLRDFHVYGHCYAFRLMPRTCYLPLPVRGRPSLLKRGQSMPASSRLSLKA
ncbi:MAG: hypothetical protein ACK2UU_12770 [Anaerolineae bacterium]